MTSVSQAYSQGFRDECIASGFDPVKVAQATVSDLYGHGAGTASNETNGAADAVMRTAPIAAGVGAGGGAALAVRHLMRGGGPAKLRGGMALARILLNSLGGAAAVGLPAAAIAHEVGGDKGMVRDLNANVRTK